jgi:hypothetical protein
VTLLLYHSPIFFFNNDGGRGWGLGIGAKCRLLSCFLLAGGAVWGKILRLLHPGGGPHSSPLDGFGEVGVPGGTTG